MTNDGNHPYTYDAEGNITQVGTNGATATYTYNALNQRVQTSASSATTNFVFNAFGQRVSTWNAATQAPIQGQYYWGNTPVAFHKSSAAHFQHQDWMGTERVRTAYNGSVEGIFTSLPFGDDLTTTSGTDTDAYHYGMLDHDYETDTEHAQFRQYSSAQGHWLAPDPYGGSYDLSNPQSFNRYVYSANNPLSNVDPSGLQDYSSSGGYASNNPNCSSGDVNCGTGWGNAWGGGVGGGLLWNQSSQYEMAWLASGSIPWYSVSAGNIMLLTGYRIANVTELNPNWDGADSWTAFDPNNPDDVLGNYSQVPVWLSVGSALSAPTTITYENFIINLPGGVSAPGVLTSSQHQGSYSGKYAAQVGCELGATASQAEPMLGSLVGTAVWGSRGNYKVASAFGLAYFAQVGIIRELCVRGTWGPEYW